MKNFYALTFLLFTSIISFSQLEKNVVFFTDKLDSPFSVDSPSAFLSQRAIDRRTNQGISIKKRDLPVNQNYIDSLEVLGCEFVYSSKWLNAVLVKADTATMITVNNQGFVNSSQILERSSNVDLEEKYFIKSTPYTNEKYGESMLQNSMLGTIKMHNNGYKGEGMIIAVLDNGFVGVDIHNGFSDLRNENRLLGYYDFVKNDENVFDDGTHGSKVLSTMAGYVENVFVGTAYKASYYLFVTENTNAELPDEEFNWVVAAERADSLGADLINTSLGYSTFQNPSLNHTYLDLDGGTTIISRGSEIAASTGMLLVTSAGNSGNGAWHYITAPGDADNIITVGAVNSNYQKTSFSSVGPTADGRIKPDLVALGEAAAFLETDGSVALGNGTSFASPLLCGLAAGFWQAHPELTNFEVIDYLKQSATQSTNPDTLQGWGVPNFGDAHVLAGGTLSINDLNEDFVSLFPNPANNNQAVEIKSDNLLSTISIVNVLGKEIYSEKVNSKNHTINLSNFKTGIFLLKIENIEGKHSFKKLQVN